MYFKEYAYNISSLRKEVSIFRVHIDVVASQQQLSCNPLRYEKVSVIPGVMLEVGFWLLFMKKETYMCSIRNTEKNENLSQNHQILEIKTICQIIYFSLLI